MKIIKLGVDPKLVQIRTTCNICETVFEFQRKEATEKYDYKDGPVLKIGCPVCGQILYVTPR